MSQHHRPVSEIKCSLGVYPSPGQAVRLPVCWPCPVQDKSRVFCVCVFFFNMHELTSCKYITLCQMSEFLLCFNSLWSYNSISDRHPISP